MKLWIDFAKFRKRRSTLFLALLPFFLVSCGPSSCQNELPAGAAGDSQHVVILLDKSASMDYLVSDVIAGFNNLVDQLPSSSFVSLFGFESINGLESIFSHVPANSVRELTSADYYLGDGTPLYDAISGAINQIKIGSVTSSNEKILFVVISDGIENSSTRYSLSDTQEAIRQEISNGWDIRFYGLGPDAASEAINLGIPIDDGSTFSPSQSGVDGAFDDIAGSLIQGNGESSCVRAIP